LHLNITVGFLDAAMPSNVISVASEETISFRDVDIVTPSQKLLASQLSCDVSQGKSLLVTGMSSDSFCLTLYLAALQQCVSNIN
jgi:hypothetical protein